ncbi:MAG TPA: ferric reductase-like transmembrane domain-containing protein, partial [Eoetvoesiella sp.]
MKAIRIIYSVLFVALTFLWLLADNPFQSAHAFFPLRSSLVNYTGVLAMGAMSVGMVLALRPFAIESFLGGMDKSYRLHKWLGVTALVVSVIHWLWAVVPKWMVGWGMLIKPAGGAQQARPPFVEWLSSQRGLAEQLGEWIFYAATVLIILALIKRFPYRHFFKTHRVLALIYLVLVYHSIILMKTEYWLTALGMVMALLMFAGTIAAILSLTGKIGYRMRAVGIVEALEYFQDNRVLNVAIQLRDQWAPHQAGQFAFVTFDEKEGAHPFTISSSWNHHGRLNFHIKELGDYTRTLPSVLKPGQAVVVEGPYGRFEFGGPQQRQI